MLGESASTVCTRGKLIVDGNVGIGTTAPAACLDIRTSSATLCDQGAALAIENTHAWCQGLAFYIWGATTYANCQAVVQSDGNKVK